MAFVSPLTSSAFTSSVPTQSSVCSQANRSSSSIAAPRIRSVTPAPRMAFSSIDVPGSTVSLAEPSFQTKEEVIYATYKHVFGNVYLMESEREELAVAESQFKDGELNVRDFIRAMGKSEQYRKRFFERAGPYAFIALNFKHFLGRAPRDQKEISYHVQLLNNDGYDAEIDSYFDSEEYEERFGPFNVPRFIYTGTYLRNDDFNRMNLLRKHWDGCSTSTETGSTAPGGPIPPKFNFPEGAHCSNPAAIQKGIRAGYNFPPAIKLDNPYQIPLNAQAPVRFRLEVCQNLYVVYETDPQLIEEEPDWKKEMVAADSSKKWNGVWF